MRILRVSRFALVFASILGLSACVTTGKVEPIQPGEKPAIDSDEAGLWLQSEKVEKSVRESGKVVTDPALNSYVKGIICKLEPEYCDDIRLYIVKTAGMNAMMAPHGAMYVWTGTFLRLENEAQLASLLGHELAHYRLRHSVQRWRETRATLDGLAFFAVATAGVGLLPLAGAGILVAEDNITSFSRENEREADAIGFDSMVSAGYDPKEAAKIWALSVKEKEASNLKRRSFFGATHPQSAERAETLRQKAGGIVEGSDSFVVGRERYIAEIRPFRRAWLEQEVKYSDFGRGLVVVDHMLEKDPDAGDLFFAKGEILRRRDSDGDLEKAVEAYQRALSTNDSPIETYRSLGLAQWSLDRKKDAAEAFEGYLIRNPEASDHLIIKSYIEQLQ